MSAFYSIKNRKFIKAYIKKVGWEMHYRLLPGNYIRLEWEYWTKDDPPNTIYVALTKLVCKGDVGNYEDTTQTVIRFYNAEFLTQFPEQVRDFYSWRPGYHGVPSINFDKVYSEEEHQKLIELAKSGKLIIEGEENE
jgi:hypothetical protein